MTSQYIQKLKRTISLLLAACLLLTASGCSGGKGSKAKFSYYLGESVTSLDPQTADGEAASLIAGAVFEGLCRLDQNNGPIPGVARAWFSNPEHTRYVFLLRDDAVWSNGEPVTAYDFAFAFRRAVNPDTMAANVDDLFVIKNARDIYSGVKDPSELGVRADSEYTLTVELEQGDSSFPAATASMRFMPCNEKFFASTSGRYGLEDQYLITNGPFSFSSWNSEKSISLYRSEYWTDLNTPAGLTFYMTDDSVISEDPVKALIDNTADILRLNESQATAAAGLGCVVDSFVSGTTGLVFNTSEQYLSSAGLRELFVKSIDRQAVLEDLPVQAADDIMPQSILWGSELYGTAAERGLYVKQDPEAPQKTASILKELELETIPPVTVLCKTDELSLEIANRIISSWNKAIGSYFNILPLDDDAYYQKLYARDYQIALCTVASSGSTPYSFLKHFESTASPLLLDSKAYDTLLHSAEKTAEDYAGLEKFLNNQYIFYPLTAEKTYYGTSPKVKDLIVSIGRVDFTRASK